MTSARPPTLARGLISTAAIRTGRALANDISPVVVRSGNKKTDQRLFAYGPSRVTPPACRRTEPPTQPQATGPFLRETGSPAGYPSGVMLAWGPIGVNDAICLVKAVDVVRTELQLRPPTTRTELKLCPYEWKTMPGLRR